MQANCDKILGFSGLLNEILLKEKFWRQLMEIS